MGEAEHRFSFFAPLRFAPVFVFAPAGEERTRRGGAGMTQRSVNTGAGASTPRQSGHTAAERARRGGAAPPQHLLSSLLVRCPASASSRSPGPLLSPFLQPHPSCLRRAPGPTLSPNSPHPTSGHPAPRAPRPAPVAASSALPPPSRCPLTPPPPTLPGSLSLPPNTPTPAALPLHVHARCAHAREFSHTLFARLKK